jgi:glyoxylase-like metal-dependent hydrolase (beta-lactamase superfamily II)
LVEVLRGIHMVDLSEAGRMSLECYILDCPEGVVLVDTGMRESAIDKIGAELKSMGRRWGEIKVVLITHRHGDHVNNLPKVKELTGTRVMAHMGDSKAIQESTKVEVEGLRHGETLQYCGGIEVIHIPGHSEGNCCYYLPKKRVMIAGDTIFGDEEGNLSPPPERYCLDVEQASRGIKRLLDYDFDTLLITHGKNVMRGAKERVKELCK